MLNTALTTSVAKGGKKQMGKKRKQGARDSVKRSGVQLLSPLHTATEVQDS